MHLLKWAILALCLIFSTTLFAKERDYSDIHTYNPKTLSIPLTQDRFAIIYYNIIAKNEWVPKSYRYITPSYKNIDPQSELYRAIQKGMYMNFDTNGGKIFPSKTLVTEDTFAFLIKRHLHVDINFQQGKRLTAKHLIETLWALYQKDTPETESVEISDDEKFPLLNQIYSRLKNDTLTFTGNTSILIDGAIQWMSKSINDAYTTYFPPVENKDLSEQLSGNFEGIGIHLDELIHDTSIKIIAIIPGSPAEKSWLISGDEIYSIDSYNIQSGTTIRDVISRIKWPKGTPVTLKIQRNGILRSITIVRDTITIENITYERIWNNTSYVRILLFSQGIAEAFSTVMQAIVYDNPERIIFDLRDNPGGSLDDVTSMLAYFVPKWERILQIRYKNSTSDILSTQAKAIQLEGKKIILLINEWSASASEIFAWVLREYNTQAKVIWTKSYGKGSVQNIESYTDGSSLKYTIAKWYTGKNLINVSWIGLSPDLLIPFDGNMYQSSHYDNQLEQAKKE